LVIAGYRLDPVFERMPDDAVIGFIRYDIHLDGRFVGSRRTHATVSQSPRRTDAPSR
jgi:hypothetical protein